MYPVAALAVENAGPLAADGPPSLVDTVVGGMMLANVLDSLVGLTDAPAAVVPPGNGPVVVADVGGAMAAKEGESVGKVKPCDALGVEVFGETVPIGGGANAVFVDGVLSGALGVAIGGKSDCAKLPAAPELVVESDFGVTALDPNA